MFTLDPLSLHASIFCAQFLIGDGQVSLGPTIIKPNARKVRQLKEGVICGFAGATADAMTLFERLEMKLQARAARPIRNQPNLQLPSACVCARACAGPAFVAVLSCDPLRLFTANDACGACVPAQEHPETMRACVEMAKAWRMDKYLRKLEAIMIVCDANVSLTLTGTGDVIEPVDGVIGIGSGGMFATAAARALLDVEGMDAEAIGRKAMTVAADMCVYTNHNFIEMTLDQPATDGPSKTEEELDAEAKEKAKAS